MLWQLAVGGLVSLANIAIHSLIMTAVVRVAQAAAGENKPHSSLFLIAVMVPTVSVLMVAHALEVFVWSLAYWIVDAASQEANLVDFAFVNYTTLGYGDVTPVERWRLLGPVTAMNGILLFGWSTAVIFAILQRTLSLLEIGKSTSRQPESAAPSAPEAGYLAGDYHQRRYPQL
jgi:hypothetical protein